MKAKFIEYDADNSGLVSLEEAKAVLLEPPFNFTDEKVSAFTVGYGKYPRCLSRVCLSVGLPDVCLRVFCMKALSDFDVNCGKKW